MLFVIFLIMKDNGKTVKKNDGKKVKVRELTAGDFIMIVISLALIFGGGYLLIKDLPK